MKTPRELILERHRSAETRLQTMDAEQLASYARESAAQDHRRSSFSLAYAAGKFWRESLWPWRRIWIGLAAVWVVCLALDLATRETIPMALVQTIRPTPEVLAAFREQARLMELPEMMPPLHPKIPGPRSERTLPEMNLTPSFKYV